jgi:hypothetical protein
VRDLPSGIGAVTAGLALAVTSLVAYATGTGPSGGIDGLGSRAASTAGTAGSADAPAPPTVAPEVRVDDLAGGDRPSSLDPEPFVVPTVDALADPVGLRRVSGAAAAGGDRSTASGDETGPEGSEEAGDGNSDEDETGDETTGGDEDGNEDEAVARPAVALRADDAPALLLGAVMAPSDDQGSGVPALLSDTAPADIPALADGSEPGEGGAGVSSDTRGDLAAGDLAAGDLAAGDLAAGDLAAGDLAAGDPAAGDPAAGDPAAGDPAAGDPAAGDPAAGDPADPAGTDDPTDPAGPADVGMAVVSGAGSTEPTGADLA